MPKNGRHKPHGKIKVYNITANKLRHRDDYRKFFWKWDK